MGERIPPKNNNNPISSKPTSNKFDDKDTNLQPPLKKVRTQQQESYRNVLQQLADEYGVSTANQLFPNSDYINREPLNTDHGIGQISPTVVWNSDQLQGTSLYRGLTGEEVTANVGADLPVTMEIVHQNIRPNDVIQFWAPPPYKAILDGNQQNQMKVMNDGNVGQIFVTPICRAGMKFIFGRDLSDQQIRGLAGGVKSCDVSIKDATFTDLRGKTQSGVKISLKPTELIMKSEMIAYREDGKVHVYQQHCDLAPSSKAPGNLAGCLLIMQVYTARSLDIATLANLARRDTSPDGMSRRVINDSNGYYTWARYGGDAPLPSNESQVEDDSNSRTLFKEFRKALEDPNEAFGTVELYRGVQQFRNMFEDPDTKQSLTREGFCSEVARLRTKWATTGELRIRDLMQTIEGRALWRTFGFSIPLTFDVSPNSWTMQTLRSYAGTKCCFDMSNDTWK